MTTQFSAMIVPSEWNDYIELTTTEKSRLFASGLIADLSAEVGAQLESPLVHMPFFDDLDAGDDHEEVIMDDTEDLEVDGITTGMDIAVKVMAAKAYGATDLAQDLSGADPLSAIQNKFAGYWARRFQRQVLAVLAGALGSAGMEDHVLDITALQGDAAKFDPDSFVDASFMLGDESGGLQAVAVHSLTLKAMVKADMIIYIDHPSDTKLQIPTYMGKEVIVDDGMPVTGTGPDKVFTSYLFGPGAIGYASKAPKVPVEDVRMPLKGMGQDAIINRKQWVLHPRGIKWKGNAVKAAGPKRTELANPANWERVYEGKLIRLVKFVHKL